MDKQDKQGTQPLEVRPDLEWVTVYEVGLPHVLPALAYWLCPGAYAIYEGEFKSGGAGTMSEVEWAWRIEYVDGINGRLDYAVFLSPRSQTFGRYAGFPVRPTGFPGRGLPRPDWLSVATIFPFLFDRPAERQAQVLALGRTLDCVEITSPPLGGPKGSGLYERKKQLLTAMTFTAGAHEICQFKLSSTNVSL